MERIKKYDENGYFGIYDDFRTAHNVEDTSLFFNIVNNIDNLFIAKTTDGIRRQCEYTNETSDARLISLLTFFDGDSNLSEPVEEQLVIWYQSYKPPFTHKGGYSIRLSITPSFSSEIIVTNYYIEQLANGTFFGTMTTVVGDPIITSEAIDTIHEPQNMTMYDLDRLAKIITTHLDSTNNDNAEVYIAE